MKSEWVRRGDSQSGAALFAALALLLIFAMLGTAYVRYMSVNFQDTRNSLQRLRADYLGHGGVYATIGEIQDALSRGSQPEQAYSFQLHAYRTEQENPHAAYPQQIEVTVRDESGRVNLNHAPAPLLIALGIPQAALARMRGTSSSAPLASVDDLRTRDHLNSQEFGALNMELFTVHTGDAGGATLNLNSAAPAVLAAVFNVDLVEAQSIATKRPFRSWQDTVTKVGREPSTFTIPTHPDRSLPNGIALSSNCYRLLSEAHLITPDTTVYGLHVAVDVVVQMNDDGGYSICHWNEHPPDAAYQAVEGEIKPGQDAPDAGEQAGSTDIAVALAVAQKQ